MDPKLWGLKRGNEPFPDDFNEYYSSLPPLPVLQSDSHVQS